MATAQICLAPWSLGVKILDALHAAGVQIAKLLQSIYTPVRWRLLHWYSLAAVQQYKFIYHLEAYWHLLSVVQWYWMSCRIELHTQKADRTIQTPSEKKTSEEVLLAAKHFMQPMGDSVLALAAKLLPFASPFLSKLAIWLGDPAVVSLPLLDDTHLKNHLNHQFSEESQTTNLQTVSCDKECHWRPWNSCSPSPSHFSPYFFPCNCACLCTWKHACLTSANNYFRLRFCTWLTHAMLS